MYVGGAAKRPRGVVSRVASEPNCRSCAGSVRWHNSTRMLAKCSRPAPLEWSAETTLSFARRYTRASTFDTVMAAQRPPRAVGTPRAFKASAMARSVLAPAR